MKIIFKSQENTSYYSMKTKTVYLLLDISQDDENTIETTISHEILHKVLDKLHIQQKRSTIESVLYIIVENSLTDVCKNYLCFSDCKFCARLQKFFKNCEVSVVNRKTQFSRVKILSFS